MPSNQSPFILPSSTCSHFTILPFGYYHYGILWTLGGHGVCGVSSLLLFSIPSFLFSAFSSPALLFYFLSLRLGWDCEG